MAVIMKKQLNMRKYINFWVYWVLGCMSMLTWSGCSDEVLLQDETIEKQETFRLTVSQEQKDKSRLAFNEDLLTTYWENGDKLYLYKVDDTTKQYKLQTELAKPSATAIFTCNEVLSTKAFRRGQSAGKDRLQAE